mmetsp:Transcript_25368/g.22184  ORF Transcript_25368/g.22184 Transcript_25368/m.22184 type:complete len:83 (+) Transcript_25368:3-251(+)
MNGAGLMGVYDEGSDNDEESPINHENIVMIGSQENIQLMGDSDDQDNETDDEQADEGMYDNNRRNMTRRIPSDEDDEDVVPQ